MYSKIYVGQVRHKRYLPHEHTFNYRMFMMYLDLDELPSLFDRFLFWSVDKINLAQFKRSHHLGDRNTLLKESVKDLVYREKDIQLNGPIRLLTNLSYFGYGFNPVSFYYCFDKSGETLEVIVAEVNNTPWGDQYSYVLPVEDKESSHHDYHLNKDFHVSPFNPMNQQYEWSLSEPGRSLSVYMQNYTDGLKVFDAGLSLKQEEINHRSLSRVLSGFPLMTVKVVVAIYFEAFKLWLKKTPIYDYPGKATDDCSDNLSVDISDQDDLDNNIIDKNITVISKK